MEVKIEVQELEDCGNPDPLGFEDNSSIESDTENESNATKDNQGKEPVKLGPQQYSCPFCSKIMNTPSKIKRHILVHTGEKPYQCHICNYKATQEAHIKTHMKGVHS